MRQLTLPRPRAVAGAVVGLSVATVAIAWMHTSAGRVLLAKLGVPCPVNQVDARRVLAARDYALASARGTVSAPERPALGMRLDVSTESEVAAWAARSGTRCDAITRGYHYLRCRGVPAATLGLVGPPVSEIWFSFAPNQRLNAINLYRRDMTPQEAQQSWQYATGSLRAALGAPTQLVGDPSLAAVLSRPVDVARVRYVYADYLATVTASHTPTGGLAVREQYLSAVAAPTQVPGSG